MEYFFGPTYQRLNGRRHASAGWHPDDFTINLEASLRWHDRGLHPI